ncbi:MAG: circadian clock KaiB family protein [Acidobacteriota bacterium]
MSKTKNKAEEFEKALAERGLQRYVLRLYVSGMSPRSLEAIASIRRICEEHLKGRYEIEVIDIYEHPEVARKQQILAAPTLIKTLPPPLRKFIGGLSDEGRVLRGLDLLPKE